MIHYLVETAVLFAFLLNEVNSLIGVHLEVGLEDPFLNWILLESDEH